MEAACIRQTELPHASRLFTDFTYHFDRVARFYPHPPHDLAALRASAAAIQYPDERRAAMVAALRRQNGDSPALDRLAQPGTVAVVTGQQVGLFSGPAYTIYKALSAVRTAAFLTANGVAAVPIFWLATEDHDLAEIDHAYVFGPDHQPVRLKADARSDGGRPVGDIPMDAVPVEELHRALGDLPFADEVAAMVRDAYRPGATFGHSFRQLLSRILAKFGLIFLDPLADDIRSIGGPFLRGAVEQAPELKSALLRRNSELAAAGYHAQVHIEPQTSLFFLLDGGRRTHLKAQNGNYVGKDARYSAGDLAAEAERLSPNALLRPVMQDYLLPTVAYIGGPAELAYMAQAEVLYEQLLGRMPVVEHRASFTILDQRASKLFDKYRLTWPEVYAGEVGLSEAIAQRLVPPSLQRTFGDTTNAVEKSLFRLGQDLATFDPTLVAALEKSRKKIDFQLEKIQKKAAREALRRETRAQADAHFLAGLLYPEKHLQERLYSILPFLAKHGFDLLDAIHERVNLDCPDHQVLVV